MRASSANTTPHSVGSVYAREKRKSEQAGLVRPY
jgi:hypothetical protein